MNKFKSRGVYVLRTYSKSTSRHSTLTEAKAAASDAAEHFAKPGRWKRTEYAKEENGPHFVRYDANNGFSITVEATDE